MSVNSIEVLALDALQELAKLYNNRLDKVASHRWLDSHITLYERRMEFPLKESKCYSFSSIYSELHHLSGYFQYIGRCEEALLDWGRIDFKKEPQILDWLIRYEDFGLTLELFYANTCFQHSENEKHGYISLIGEPSIWVKTSDYSPVVDFLYVFSRHYWDIIERYARKEENLQDTGTQELYYGPVTKSLKEYVASSENK